MRWPVVDPVYTCAGHARIMLTAITDLDAQLANTREYWLRWGLDRRLDTDGVTLYRSGITHPRLNGVLAVRGGSLDRAITVARQRLHGVPWIWTAGPDSNPGVAQDLLIRGASLVGTTPIMAVKADRFRPPLEAPPGLRIEEVESRAGIEEWARAGVRSFDLAPDQVGPFVRAEVARSAPDERLVRFAARLDGVVVGTAQLFVSDGVAGVYLVMTAAAHRRRGIGAALSAAAVRAGWDRGCRVASVQAGPAGVGLYQRMGFEQVGTYRLLRLPSPNGGR